ncbi:hypothetical protein ACFQJ7_01395 [Halovenus rubra]|uniref:Uncharacterized protein n=2 Tax=Halovenus rubra TaxID=869890 RepID=A0ACC7E1E1_9EURY|nr:hypothetical protein [Halovenus rubra]
MSLAEPLGHLGGLDLADRCNTPVLADLLDERDLLGHGPLIDGTLTQRDTDRVRIAKFIASKPEGTPLTHVVSYAVKGVNPNHCEHVDGSDPDYQFAYRFINDLVAPDDPYVRKSESSGVLFVTPTVRLLDLITEGITQTTHTEGLTYDREFLRNYLARVDSVDDDLRELLVDGFTSYLNRIEDYRLLFDVHFVDLVDDSLAILYSEQSLEEGRAKKIKDDDDFLITGPWSATEAQITGLAGLLAGLLSTSLLAEVEPGLAELACLCGDCHSRATQEGTR